MTLQIPPEVAAVLEKFDDREDTFEVIEVMGEVEKAVTDPKSLSQDAKRGWWAECAAFAFDTHESPDGGPWKTYFQPMMTVGQGETMRCKPDLRQADADVIAYWGERAKAVKHPVLAARYADLVWDTTKFVTKGKPGIEFARIAVDSYVAGFNRDDGEAWGDNVYNLGRALHIALSIRDEKRTARWSKQRSTIQTKRRKTVCSAHTATSLTTFSRRRRDRNSATIKSGRSWRCSR